LSTAVARLEVTFVDTINVNNNKMVFSSNDCVLIKLLKQKKGYGAKSLLQNLPANRGHCQD